MIGKIILVVVAIALLMGAGVITFTKAATLSADGSAEIKALPDEVSVYLRVTQKNASAEAARDRAAEITDELQTQLIKLGIAQKDIQLENYNVYAWTEWINNRNMDKGFVVEQGIVVKTADFGKVSGIVDAAINAGALVSYINSELSEQKVNDFKAQALEQAAKNARIKAESVASGLGKRIGGVVSVETTQEPFYTPYPYYRATAEVAGAADIAQVKEAAANLAPTESTISANVRVTYKLKRFWLF
jgi:uncharacterized protein YggE